eukprot:874660_1
MSTRTVTTIGDKVKLRKKISVGTVRFIGQIQGKRGIFYGIQLDEAKGTNNGNIGDIAYFKCGPKRGLFIKKNEIIQTNIKHNQNAPRVTIGDHVKCINAKCNGIIKFIGTPYPVKQEGTFYGVQLDKPKGKNNGTVKGRWYFDCAYKYGTFLDASGFKPLPKPEHKDTRDSDDTEPIITTTVGDRVKVIEHEQVGIVRFIGEIQHKKDVYYGIELYRPSGSGHGRIGKISYFKCKPQRGIFITPDEIAHTFTEKNKKAPRVTVGGQIECIKKGKCRGTIRFIGTPYSVHKSGIFYGVQLDKPKGKHNGAVHGRQYFKCKPKHGVFLKSTEFNVLTRGRNKRSRSDATGLRSMTHKPVLDVSNNKRHKNMFNHFIDNIYELCVDDFIALEKRYVNPLRNIDKSDVKKRIFNDNVMQSVLTFYKNTLDALQKYTRKAQKKKLKKQEHVQTLKLQNSKSVHVSSVRNTNTTPVGRRRAYSLKEEVSPSEASDSDDSLVTPEVHSNNQHRPRAIAFKDVPYVESNEYQKAQHSPARVDMIYSKSYGNILSSELDEKQSNSSGIRSKLKSIFLPNKSQKKKPRRNSDTIVWTPSGINYEPSVMNIHLNQTQRIDITPASNDDTLLSFDVKRPMQLLSPLSPPNMPLMSPNMTHNASSTDNMWVSRQSNNIHQMNKQMIQQLLAFEHHSWDFDNEVVYMCYEQWKNVKYETFVPSLKDVVYPTMLSSLTLPESAQAATYSVIIKYCLGEMAGVNPEMMRHLSRLGNDNEQERVRELIFEFSFKTTIKIAIQDIIHKIKAIHPKYCDYISKLCADCFLVKVCGREEYLKCDAANNKIISLSYIRNCIRRHEINGMELVLLYDDSLLKVNDDNMKAVLRKSYNEYYDTSDHEEKMQVMIQYEDMGYNVITNTLADTIGGGAGKLKNSLGRLYDDIEQELSWIHRIVGEVEDLNLPQVSNMSKRNSLSIAQGHRRKRKSLSVTQSRGFKAALQAFKWKDLKKNAILLSGFVHPIEFSVSSLKNIELCPRFEGGNNNYYGYVLRIELMFGVQVFEECSWDISIPKSKMSNNIELPPECCMFSTEDADLLYASLPREAVWCFTLYGIRKDEAIEQQIQKQDKKKKKKEPKILRGVVYNKPNSALNANGYTAALQLDDADITSYKLADIDDMEQIVKREAMNDFYNDGDDDNESMHSHSTQRSKATNLRSKSQYTSEAIAWCRLPMVDHRHCLRKGRQTLHLWTVPLFEKVKGGPKIDPYTTGNWKKFGSMRHCNLKRKKSDTQSPSQVILSVDFMINYTFDVVAPIVNERRPHYLRRKIKPSKQKEYVLQVLDNVLQRDGIFPLDERDKLLVYSNKEKLMRDSSTIPTFLRSVNWLDAESRMEAYDYLEKWAAPKNPEDMIELLRYEFADNRIRLYAINCLN